MNDSRKKNALGFDPSKHLFELSAVRIVVACFVSLAAVSWLTIYVNTPALVFDFSSGGFNNFLTIFRVPLGILALMIPFIALIASNHRSVQTSEQIDLATQQIASASEQNRFANYYKHREEFGKYVASLARDNQPFKLTSVPRLYRAIYPDAARGVIHNSPIVVDHCESIVSRLEEIWTDLGSQEINSKHIESCVLSHLLILPGVTQTFKTKSRFVVSNWQGGEGVSMPLPATLIQYIQLCVDYVNSCLEFDPEFERSIGSIHILESKFDLDQSDFRKNTSELSFSDETIRIIDQLQSDKRHKI